MVQKPDPRDLGPAKRDLELCWKEGEVAKSLDILFKSAIEDAEKVANWYLREKNPNKRYCRRVRAFAIAAGGVGAVIPVLAQLHVGYGGVGNRIEIQPVWASIALLFAAAPSAIDQLFGFSSAWMRYTSAGLRLRQLTQDFQYEWTSAVASWAGAEPTTDQAVAAIGRIRAFIAQVNAVVKEETDAWIMEFKAALAQLDQAAKAKADAGALGAVNITVTNGDASAGGWNLQVDGNSGTNYTGKTVGITGLAPGPRHIRISGSINNQPASAGKVINVPAGGVANEELTLA